MCRLEGGLCVISLGGRQAVSRGVTRVVYFKELCMQRVQKGSSVGRSGQSDQKWLESVDRGHSKVLEQKRSRHDGSECQSLCRDGSEDIAIGHQRR